MLYKSKSAVGNRRHPAVCLCPFNMKLWLLLTFAALAECGRQQRDASPCPRLCVCAFPPSGEKVMCSHDSLAKFPSDGLSPNVAELSVISSNISSVTAAHLRLLPHLTTLQLYYSNLTSLAADLLTGVPRLNSLDLTGNRLSRLPPGIFNLTSLHSLVMKNNRFEEVDAEWFPLNSSIASLDLSGNRLTGVSAAMFQRLPHLQDLDLSDNDLQELPPNALSDLHRLATLNLAGNKLVSLKPDTFAGNLQLSQLFLQENRLRELPAGLFRGLTQLELLLLNQNQLQFLPAGLLDDRKASFLMIITGNPWKCDGKMEYLWRWLRERPQSVTFLEEVTCDGPETLKLKQVASLTDRQLSLMDI